MKIKSCTDELFNLIQFVNLDPSEYEVAPTSAKVFPGRVPVSSVILAFVFLV